MPSQWLVEPSRLWSRDEVLVRPCAVPTDLGVYTWCFRTILPGVPADCGAEELEDLGFGPLRQQGFNRC